MSGAINLLFYTPSWRGGDNFTIYLARRTDRQTQATTVHCYCYSCYDLFICTTELFA